MGVLRALRNYGDAHDRMSSGMKGAMGMNLNDLATLRMLIMREDKDQLVTPADIARHLRISTASTTTLIDRLSKSGHVKREAHPSDRRAITVVLTAKAKQDFFKNFGRRLSTMRNTLENFTTAEVEAASRVLTALTKSINEE